MTKQICLFLVLILCSSCLVADKIKDPYLWLEEIEGEKALSWVRAQNDLTTNVLEKEKDYDYFLKTSNEILNAKDRIPYGTIRGKYIYNFWRDEKHIRGILRRTSLSEYQKENPKWEIVLDVDKLAKEEKENWVYKRAVFLIPENRRCLIKLSRGGKDASVVREFDVVTKSFVKNGFYLKEAKSRFAWVDKDTILVGTDFGEGSLTTSGYPRIIKRWSRGTTLDKAKNIFEVQTTDVSSYPYVDIAPYAVTTVLSRSITFYRQEFWVYDHKADRKIRIPVPQDSRIQAIFQGKLLFQLKSDWTIAGKTFVQGSIISFPVSSIEDKEFGSNIKTLLIPHDRMTIESVITTANYVYVNYLENVTGKIKKFQYVDDKWTGTQLPLPANGSVYTIANGDFTDRIFAGYVNFLTPSSLYYYSANNNKLKKIKAHPAKFDASNLLVKQFHATSKDGTKIPYFIVHKKNIKLDGTNPTLVYGYGGFEHSLSPYYPSVTGKLWLERGGVYVLANIRGGGEFGPKWHQAALKENRQLAFDDFIAVSEDVIKREITSPGHLGIYGGSNGGLLVGAVFTQRPELFKAVVCSVPLLDMIRYNKLLAGASWMGEFGNPDDEKMRKVLLSYSPYHQVKKDKKYPKVYFFTSTKDDRVHPGHARKMVAKMKGMGHDIFYYENIEGGHGGAANNIQRARMVALRYAYLWKMLK